MSKRSLVEGQRQRTAAARHDPTGLVLPAAAAAAAWTSATHAPALAGKLQLARKTGIFSMEHVALRSIPREALADKLRVLSIQHCHVSQLVHLCVNANCVGAEVCSCAWVVDMMACFVWQDQLAGMATAAPCLRTLVLRHNNLRQLPAELRFPRGLEHLDLAHNVLSLAQDLDLALPKLRQCFLEYNKVDRLPLSLWSAASLRLLNASNNLLTCLPGSTAAHVSPPPGCRCVRAVGV